MTDSFGNSGASASILPTISVVIATFNSSRTLERCLQSLHDQDYPIERIELILADGGSTDNTAAIAARFGARIVNVPSDKQGAEYNKGYGLQFATGEFLLCIDHDNILPHRGWLKAMLQPLLDHPEAVASEPLRYRYDRSISLLDRYFALYGVNDPLPYYLGKADRMDYIHRQYNLLGQATDVGAYYIVKFDSAHPRRIPTLGANGFLIRRAAWLQSQHDPDHYFHIDINVDLVAQGLSTYAFIKDDIIHLSNNQLWPFLKRRQHFMNKYYLNSFSSRRYSVYDSADDKLKLIWFVFLAVTTVKPLFDSIRGWLKIHDRAWFVHPLMCWAVVWIYGTALIRGYLSSVK